MYLFGEKVKTENSSRTIGIIVCAIIWRYFVDYDFEGGIRDPYILPTIGFVMSTILLGELSRRLFRLFIPKANKRHHKHLNQEQQVKDNERQNDREALNFGLLWSILFIAIVIF